MKRSLYLKQGPPPGDWALTLHQKSHDRLQTGKSGNQERNAAIFDHCNLTNIQVCLNHSRYPSADTATDFVKEQYVGVYKSFYDFASRYYGIDNLLAGSQVNPTAYKALNSIQFTCLMYQSRARGL